MKIINNKDPDFLSDLQYCLESRSQENNEEIDFEVKNIISEVKKRGDEALFYFSKKFDGVDLYESNLLISRELRNEYKNKIDLTSLKSFETAIDNVTNFHQKQLPQNYEINKNGLKEVEKILDVQSKLIVNRSAYKTKTKMVESVIESIKKIIL